MRAIESILYYEILEHSNTFSNAYRRCCYQHDTINESFIFIARLLTAEFKKFKFYMTTDGAISNSIQYINLK